VDFTGTGATRWCQAAVISCSSAPAACPVDAFWSLAAYTRQDMNLIPDAADRHTAGDRTPGLRWGHDDGLTIPLQPGTPGGYGEPHWLPTSASQCGQSIKAHAADVMHLRGGTVVEFRPASADPYASEELTGRPGSNVTGGPRAAGPAAMDRGCLAEAVVCR
jgi:Protein of unknown function (DUF1214)